MRAVVYEEYGQTPQLRDVPPPDCPEDGVVLDVAATGVCRSDWHAWRGHDPVPLPHVPGHELAGTVARIGRDVRHFAIGDRVTAPFVCGCGRCEQCRDGDAQVCPHQTQPGFTHAGSFAEQVALHAADTNLVRLPDGMDPVVAASLGCRFATAFRAVRSHAAPAAGQWVAVHGCGGVGLSAVMVAVALGARVVATDVHPAALDAAKDLGAEATVLVGATPGTPPGEAVAAEVRRLTGGGAHASLDALGSPATAAASVRSLRPRGRHVQVGLLLGEEAGCIPMDLVVARELAVLGSHGMAATDYPEMLQLVDEGVLHPDRLVGRVIELDQAPQALVAMDRPATGTGMTVVRLHTEPARAGRAHGHR
jgi:alcohol dehydrogenase